MNRTHLFADEEREAKLGHALRDAPLVDYATLTDKVDRPALRPSRERGGHIRCRPN